MKNPQMKVGRVMREFKKGELKSSSGQKVTNPKQAIAIGLSEAGISKKARGGEMKESKAMMKKEVSFMKKKGAPKSMVKHEEAEMKGMKKGGDVKKMAMGGFGSRVSNIRNKVSQIPRSSNVSLGGMRTPAASRVVDKFPTSTGMMKKGGSVKKMAAGGLAAGHKSADGVASKGKTKGKEIVMKGGKGMKKGGYC